MKILIGAIGYYADRPSGSAKIAFDEGQALVRKHHEVFFLVPRIDGMPEYESRDGVTVLRYTPAPKQRWGLNRVNQLRRSVHSVLSKYLPRVDAVHGHSPLEFDAAQRFYGYSVQSAYTLHSPAQLEMSIIWRRAGLRKRMLAPLGLWLLGRVEGRCITRANAVTALSQFTVDQVAELHGREVAHRIRVIPGWVEPQRFLPIADRSAVREQLGWNTNGTLLFTLRRLQPRMGLEQLVEAHSLALKDGFDCQLVIGGDGPIRPNLEAQVASLGTGHRVKFMGRLSDAEVPLAYAACDVFVLPTAALECFGLIALEAMSCGRPVLATPIGAIPEVVGRFEEKWLAASPSAADLFVLMRKFLRNELPPHSSEELRNFVVEHYDSRKVMPTFLAHSLQL